jgi:hypothetical protein
MRLRRRATAAAGGLMAVPLVDTTTAPPAGAAAAANSAGAGPHGLGGQDLSRCMMLRFQAFLAHSSSWRAIYGIHFRRVQARDLSMCFFKPRVIWLLALFNRSDRTILARCMANGRTRIASVSWLVLEPSACAPNMLILGNITWTRAWSMLEFAVRADHPQ